MAAWLPGPRQPLVASAGLMDIRKRVPTVARGSFGFEETRVGLASKLDNVSRWKTNWKIISYIHYQVCDTSIDRDSLRKMSILN